MEEIKSYDKITRIEVGIEPFSVLVEHRPCSTNSSCSGWLVASPRLWRAWYLVAYCAYGVRLELSKLVTQSDALEVFLPAEVISFPLSTMGQFPA